MNEIKPWYTSQTILASLGTVIISLLSVAGHQVDSELVPEFAQNIALLANAISGMWAIRGRLFATARIN